MGRVCDRDVWKHRDWGSRLSWEVMWVWTRKSDIGSRLGGTILKEMGIPDHLTCLL